MTLPASQSSAVEKTAEDGAESFSRMNQSASELNAFIVKRLEDDKAENVVEIDLEGKSSIADTMIIASGRSARHVGAIADHILRALKEIGHARAKVEGLKNGDWVLIDAGDVVIHIFRPEVRDFYNLERIWGDESAHLNA
ncbi:MAG: ribosome silencing factor [Hirschia sp.]|nr:ribosome silencing factor [Hirschia sp.]MBF18999.1 ribosome silencing factor [Hirschia sp.]|tara:strand:- start:47 stop:466 length:420 start_codon:yes stop_codon:yes gene_type:complete